MHHTHQSPCKNCADRSYDPPCHDICKKYQAYAADMVIIRERRQENAKHSAFHFDLVQKNLKRYRG